MRGYVRVSRFLVAAVLAFLVWSDLPASTTQAGAVPEATVQAIAPERSTAAVSSRGGPRPLSAPTSNREVLTAHPQSALPTLTPTPSPTQPPTPTPTPPPVLRSLGEFRVTAYSDSPYLNGTDGRGITASGEPTHWGAVAVDPRVIPLGTRLVIEGLGGTVFTALDTGGGVIGRWVDVWFPSDWDAIQHGVKHLNIYEVVR